MLFLLTFCCWVLYSGFWGDFLSLLRDSHVVFPWFCEKLLVMLLIFVINLYFRWFLWILLFFVEISHDLVDVLWRLIIPCENACFNRYYCCIFSHLSYREIMWSSEVITLLLLLSETILLKILPSMFLSLQRVKLQLIMNVMTNHLSSF